MTVISNKLRLLAIVTLLVMLTALLPVEASAASTKYAKTTTGESVNVHSWQSIYGTVVGSVPYGGKVTVYSSDSNWSYIKYNKISGYVLTRLLSSIDPGKKPEGSGKSSATASTMYVKTANGGRLNIRSNRSTKSSILTTAPYGAKVSVLRKYDDWLLVRYNGKTGYAQRAYLVLTQPEVKSSSSSSSSTSSASAHTMYIKSANGKKVNFRSSASLKGKLLDQLKVGTKVTAYGTSGSWTRIRYNGRYGYVQTAFLSSKK